MARHPVPSLTLPALVCCLSLAVPVSSAAPPIDYQKQIKPLLAKHCNGCHGSTKTMSGLRTDAGQLATRGGDRGVGIVPGQPAKSLLFQTLTGTDDLERMPFDKPPLAVGEIELIKTWILQGARFPSDEKITARRRQSDHWAFQPVLRSRLPAVSNPAWVRNAIDTFVLARLDKERLRPPPRGPRAFLLFHRRAPVRILPQTVFLGGNLTILTV